MKPERIREFDCSECGRHIISLCGPDSDRCVACMWMPGWYDNPELARILDPDYLRRPARLQ